MAESQSTAQSDPLASLHKMSTTAGLGSNEYVAINTVSVATFLLGLGSGLAFPFQILLILPIAGVVCGIISLRQISHSNGTQSGKGLAIIGLLLSLGIGGYIVGGQALGSMRNQQDEKDIAGLIEQLGQSVAAKDFDKAYALFNDNFHQRVPSQKFTDTWTAFMNSPLYGQVKKMEWNGRIESIYDPTNNSYLARGLALMTFEKVPIAGRQDIMFRKMDGKWQIEELPTLFPPPEAKHSQRELPSR